MISLAQFREMAGAFDEVTEEPHFDKTSFRIRKKIFTTLDTRHHRACVKLTEVDQSIFTSSDPKMIYAVPDKWGKMGWTYVELKKVNKKMLSALLTTAYCTVAPKTLAKKYQ